MNINKDNYYSKEANLHYCSVSQYKDFVGTMGECGCEAKALAKLKGKWQDETNTAMLIGSYVDSYFEGTLEEFKEKNPLIFKKDGTLKAEFLKAEEVIRRIEKDELFLAHLQGKKQVIMTGKLFEVPFKIKMDSFFPNKLIVDLKVVKDLNERFWIKDYGFTNFIEKWGYDLQLAVYQEIVRQNTGKRLPCVIAVCDKGKSPNIELVQIPQTLMDNNLNDIEANIKRIKDIKDGNAQPIRCEKCDYCKATKKLTAYKSIDDLIEI